MTVSYNKQIILIGGGGHCRVVIDTVRALQNIELIGVLDNGLDQGCEINGVPVLGDDSLLSTLYGQGITCAMICTGNNFLRKQLAQQLQAQRFHFVPIIHPSAVISPYAKIADGAFVAAGVVVNASASIGQHCIINTRSVIEHDCVVGGYTHIGPGAVLCGNVKVGESTMVGSMSVVIQNKEIGREVVIGAGSVIVKNISDGVKVFGNPAREIIS